MRTTSPLAVAMLEAIRAGPADPDRPRDARCALIEQIAEHAVALGLDKPRSRSRCCTASGPASSAGSPAEGYRVRDLIAYGEAWYPWYMRRLAERPANVLFALPPAAALSAGARTAR